MDGTGGSNIPRDKSCGVDFDRSLTVSYPRRSRADSVDIGRPRDERDLSDIGTAGRRFLQLSRRIDSNCDM